MPKHALFPFESDDRDIVIAGGSRHFDAYFVNAFGPFAEGDFFIYL